MVKFRRRSWSPDLRPGAQTGPVWRYQIAWVAQVVWSVSTPEGREKLRWVQPGGLPESISVDTFIAAAKEAATYADYDTGRNVTVGRTRLGLAVKRSARTMSRFWRAANALGISRTRQEGRYLDRSERAAAYRRHGNQQLRMASHRDLIGFISLGFVHLPSEGRLKANKPVLEMVKHQRARSQERATAPRPPSHDKARQKSATRRRRHVTWPREMYDFAAQLRTLLPWLRTTHPASIARTLHNAGVSPTRWAPADLVRRLTQELGYRANAARYGQNPDTPPAAYRFLNPNQTSNPLGYTHWLLHEYINPEEPTLTEDRAAWQLDHGKPIEAASSETLTADLHFQRTNDDAQIEAARVAAIDWEAVNQAIQAMHKQFPGLANS